MKLLIVTLSCLFVAITAEKFCSSNSLDSLNFSDLLKKSRIDEDCKNEARKVFEKNYKETLFTVQKNGALKESYNEVFLGQNYFVQVLQNFGDLVQKLSINALEINNETLALLNEKSSKSLKKLSFESLDGESIVDWKDSFKNVKELTLVKVSNFKSNKTFSDFFPNVEILILYELFDWKFVENKFKNVKTVTFAVSQKNIDDESEKKINNFFTNNQQIESLTIVNPPKKIVDIVVNLTNLESIEIILTENAQSSGDDVHFKTVKNLKIQSFYNLIPNGIVFDKTEDVTLDLADGDLNKNWWDFIAKKMNKDTRKLTLEQGFLTNVQFSNISSYLPELKFVYIINNNLTEKTLAEPIKTFIASSKKLNTLVLDNIQMDKDEQKKLDDLKKDKWTVEIIIEDEATNRVHLSIRNSASLITHSALLSIVAFIVTFTKLF